MSAVLLPRRTWPRLSAPVFPAQTQAQAFWTSRAGRWVHLTDIPALALEIRREVYAMEAMQDAAPSTDDFMA